jgi:hypothetical protein
LSNKHSGPKFRDHTLVTKIKSKTHKIYKEKPSITENQSNARFKIKNQSITGIISSSHEIEEQLGGKKEKNGHLQQFLQESLQVTMKHNAMI